MSKLRGKDRPQRPELPFERGASPLVMAGSWASAGLEFGLSVVLFFLGGRWLDEKVGASPWLAVAGAMVGTAVGTWLLIRPLLRRGSRGADRDPHGDPPQASGPGAQDEGP